MDNRHLFGVNGKKKKEIDFRRNEYLNYTHIHKECALFSAEYVNT